jgi:hypothetical protein
VTDISHLPTPGVILDLDLEEKPEEDVKAPFIVNIGGRPVTFANPADLDWLDLASVEIPADLIRISLTPEDREFILAQRLPSWKFGRLMKVYYEHYDMEKRIRDAQRQAAFNR